MEVNVVLKLKIIEDVPYTILRNTRVDMIFSRPNQITMENLMKVLNSHKLNQKEILSQSE